MTMASPLDHKPISGGFGSTGSTSAASSHTSTNSTGSWDVATSTASNGVNQNAAAAAAFNPWLTSGYFNGSPAFPNNTTYPSTDFTGSWPASWPHTDSRFQMNRLNVPCVSSSAYPFNLNMNAVTGAMRTSRRRRNLFTQQQVNILREAFVTENYVKPEHREALAKRTGLTPQQVKIWFQNNRYKCKQKQKEDDRSTGGVGSMDDNRSGGPMHRQSRSPSLDDNHGSHSLTDASDSPLDIKPRLDDISGITPILPTSSDVNDVKNDFAYQPDFKSITGAQNFAAMNAYSGYGMNIYNPYVLPGMTAMSYPYPTAQNTTAGYQPY